MLPGGAELDRRARARAVERALDGAHPAICSCSCPAPARSAACSGGCARITRSAPTSTCCRCYGELAPGEQDAALAPARAGRRKVVLATNIAETSLTIDGVRIVVDAGLERRSVFDPVSGMSRLETQRISRASAEQRAGRAGRTAPGVCYRLWSDSADRSLAAYAAPEIAVADLVPLALDLAAWGTAAGRLALARHAAGRDAGRRARPACCGSAPSTPSGRITPHGRAMHQLAAHPRLAHMLLMAREHGAPAAAAKLAALLSERDLLRGGMSAGSRERDSDIRTAWRRCSAAAASAACSSACAARSARTCASSAPATMRGADASSNSGLLLAFAYPDRIGKRRAGDGGRYQLANGRGASFANPEAIAREELIVAVELDDREREAQIQLAAPLARSDLLENFAAELVTRDEVAWDARAEAVVARRTVRFGELVLDEKPLQELPPGATGAALLEGLALARARRVAVGRRQPHVRCALRVRARA